MKLHIVLELEYLSHCEYLSQTSIDQQFYLRVSASIPHVIEVI